MSSRFLGPATVVAAIAIALVPPAAAAGQAPASAGKPAATKPAAHWTLPRTPDGQPDLQGIVWRSPRTAVLTYDIEAPAPAVGYPGRDLSQFRPIIVDPPDGKIPYQPWARTQRERFYQAALEPKKLNELDPQALCVISGPPRTSYHQAFQILQTRDAVIFLNESFHQYRVVPLDGRPPLSDKIRLFAGSSRGRWEGDTLVVDITNFNGRNWLDIAGDFRSPAFHVVERWTRIGPEAMRYEATIEDPVVYTRPWKMAITHGSEGADYQMLEEACYEGNDNVLPELRSPVPGTGGK